MGSLPDWMTVFAIAILLATFNASLISVQRWRNDTRPRPYLLFRELLYCSAVGLLFAIAYKFGWAAVHTPLVYIEIALLVLVLAVLFLTTKNRGRAIL
jgi:hypothetical protein